MKYLLPSTIIRQRARRVVDASTLRTIVGLAGGNSLAAVISIIGSLVQAHFVTPADLGYFRSFGIVTGYVFFLQLGTFDMLARFYPYYIGKGQREQGLAVAELCQSWIVMVTILANCIYLILALQALATGNWRAFLAWLVQVIAITGFFYGGYLSATYRSGKDFGTVARGSVLMSVVNLFTLPIFTFAPYLALALRSGTGNLLNLVYLHIKRPLRLHWRFNWNEWRALVRIGLPMFTAGYGISLGWTVTETTIILRFLGTQALGLWTMSFLLLDATNNLAQAIVAVYHPRLIETFGHTEDVRRSLALCRKPLLLGVPTMLLMAGVGAILLPFVIPILMPHYIDAIPIMSLMLLMLPLIVLDLPYALLTAMGKVAQQNIATYVALASFVLLASVALRAGFGITGVVGASLFGRGIRLTLVYGLLFRASRTVTISSIPE